MSDAILADIQRSLGRIEQKVDGVSEWMEKHTVEDRAMFGVLQADVQEIKITRAERKGAVKVLAKLVGLVTSGGAAGGLIEHFLHR